GPLLVPLMLAADIPPVIAGSALLLGSSMGGEQCNPAAVEIVTLAPLVGLSPQETVRKILPANLLACTTVLLVFWLMSARRLRQDVADYAAAGKGAPQVAQGATAERPLVLNAPAAQIPTGPTASPRDGLDVDAGQSGREQPVSLLKALVPGIPLL